MQSDWLGKIKSISLSPLGVAKDFLGKGGYVPGKVRLWDGDGIWDHRTVCENEIIFETDGPYKYNIRFKKMIETTLDDLGIPYYTFFSGGKSFHIHCFFERITFKNRDNFDMLKKAIELGLTYREIRNWFVRKICSLSGIDLNIVGPGKIIDTAPINFVSGKHHLIRAEGGRKQEWDSTLNQVRYCHYKTYIGREDKVDKKPIVTRVEDVRYPETLETFIIDEYELMELVEEYLDRMGNDKQSPEQKVDYKGKFLSLHGVTKIMDGLKPGHRSMGAQVIAIASCLDKLSREETRKVMETYVNNCIQGSSPFTIEEAMGWYEWVVSQPAIFWNCSLLKTLGVHEEEYCEYCGAKHKDAIEILERKDVLKSVEQTLSKMIAGETKLAMTEYILFNSRHFKTDKEWTLPNDPRPQAIIIASDSSSGKSYVTKQILRLFPEEDVIVRSRVTRSVLNYMVNQNYDKKIVFIEELQGYDETSNQLRLWISEGVLRLSTVENVKMPDGTIVNEEIIKETKGQPVIVTTTAQDEIDRELMNRVWILSTDMSKQQTVRVMKFHDKLEKGLYFENYEQEIRRLQDLQRELRSFHFLVPFMDMEVMKIPYDTVKVRRDYKKLIDMVKCVALLYQRQRIIAKDKKGNEYIVCSFTDFYKAIQYVDENMNATFNSLSTEQINLLMKLRNEFSPIIEGDEIEFTLSDVQQTTGLHYNKCYTIMKALTNLGFVNEDRGEHNKSIFKIVRGKDIEHLQLPTFEELKKLYDFMEFFSENPRFQFFVFDTPRLKIIENWGEIDESLLSHYGVENTRKITGVVKKQKTESERLKPKSSKNEKIAVFENSVLPSNRENFASSEKKRERLFLPEVVKKTEFSKTEILNMYQDPPTPEKVVKIIDSTKKNPVPFEDISKHFKNEKELEIVIALMKRNGDIFETKPGHYIVL